MSGREPTQQQRDHCAREAEQYGDEGQAGEVYNDCIGQDWSAESSDDGDSGDDGGED